MNTFPIFKEGGHKKVAFEISNFSIDSVLTAKILETNKEVTDIIVVSQHQNNLPDVYDEDRVLFKYRGIPFSAWEPFCDSNTYWIGPINPDEQQVDIQMLEKTFKDYQPEFLEILKAKLYGNPSANSFRNILLLIFVPLLALIGLIWLMM